VVQGLAAFVGCVECRRSEPFPLRQMLEKFFGFVKGVRSERHILLRCTNVERLLSGDRTGNTDVLLSGYDTRFA